MFTIKTDDGHKAPYEKKEDVKRKRPKLSKNHKT